MDNRTIAKRLIQIAHQLQRENESLYRVRSYRKAAETVLGWETPIEEIVLQTGRKGLKSLPGIGSSISKAIENLVRDGGIRKLIENSSGSN